MTTAFVLSGGASLGAVQVGMLLALSLHARHGHTGQAGLLELHHHAST